MITCPVCKGRKKKSCVACKGAGKIAPPKEKAYKQDLDGKRKEAAHKLRTAGYTLREIAGILGYKHPQSIQNLLGQTHYTLTKKQ